MDKSSEFKTVVDANRSLLELDFQELYNFRSLFLYFAYRDLKVRYVQSRFGTLWVFLQPAIQLAIFSAIFSMVLRVPTPIPYPLFAVSGLICWNFFTYMIYHAGHSLLNAQHLITKIYYPRLISPLSKIITGVLDFTIYLVFVAVLLVLYQYPVGSHIFLLPVAIFWLIVVSFSISLTYSVLVVRNRDLQAIMTFVIQLGGFLTPIYYGADVLADKPQIFQTLFQLNPMCLVVELFRYTITGIQPPPTVAFWTVPVIVLLFFFSVYLFQKEERTIADRV